MNHPATMGNDPPREFADAGHRQASRSSRGARDATITRPSGHHVIVQAAGATDRQPLTRHLGNTEAVDPLYRARARALIGDPPPEQMPRWAALALTRGYDSPTLRELAGAHEDPATLRDLLTDALDELGGPRLNEHQALWVMAHTYARSIVDGLISPEEGGELLWSISTSLGHPDELNGLLDEATDWEYVHELDPEEIRQRIVTEAQRLLEVVTIETLDQEPDPDRFLDLDDEAAPTRET